MAIARYRNFNTLKICKITVTKNRATRCVTGTLKHVISSVARAGCIALLWSGGHRTGGQFLRPRSDNRSQHIKFLWRPWIFLPPLWPMTPTRIPLQDVGGWPKNPKTYKSAVDFLTKVFSDSDVIIADDIRYDVSILPFDIVAKAIHRKEKQEIGQQRNWQTKRNHFDWLIGHTVHFSLGKYMEHWDPQNTQ